MGGFTAVRLKDNSPENVRRHNQKLKEHGVPKKYRFYSEDDVKAEYEAFTKGEGYFPESQFPKDKIRSYQDFTRYWNTKKLGEIFCPQFGTMTFDCYFSRMSQRAMRSVAKYMIANLDEIKQAEGSFSTFMERGMTKPERQRIMASHLRPR